MNREQYYSLPLDFSAITKKKDIKVCNFYRSIAQNIFIILTTKYDECRFSPQYGSEVWDWDFQHIPNENTWIAQMTNVLGKTIVKYETRLYDIKVDMTIQQEEIMDRVKVSYRIKRKLDIIITGIVKETREPFNFRQSLFLSPISFD